MNFYKHSVAILASFVFFSCVEDEIVFIDKGDNIRFSRSLASVAIDENPIVEVEIINRSTQESNLNAYNLEFSSSNPNVISIDSNGVLTPASGSLSASATINVIATLKNPPADGTGVNIISVPNGDSIEVGRVTISENEALSFESEELKEIILNGFEPRGVINNRVSEIDINFQDMVLSASFFNFKNIDVINPDLVWSSDNEAILRVDTETGRLIPVTMGTTTITVSATVDGQIVTAEPLIITVSNRTVVEDQPEPEVGGVIIGSGTFQSNSFYTPEGSFQIVESNGETRINLGDNFTSGGRVPDLVIYLSNQTDTNTGAQFISEDIEATGAQSFVIPANVNVSNYSNVLIYCRRFSQRVGFGIINR